MKKVLRFSDLEFEIILSNEDEKDTGLFAYGLERGATIDDISIGMDVIDFCGMSHENFEGLKTWLTENAEIYIRAAVQQRDELEEKREIARQERYRVKREEKKKNKGKKEGFVYLVAADNGLHKIGRSKHVDSRVTEFGIKLPVKTWLVHSFKSDQYDNAEIELHKHFADKRSHGEWFELSQEDVQYICSIQDGQL